MSVKYTVGLITAKETMDSLVNNNQNGIIHEIIFHLGKKTILKKKIVMGREYVHELNEKINLAKY